MNNNDTYEEEIIKLSFDFLKLLAIKYYRGEINRSQYKSMKYQKLQFLRSCRVWL